MTDLIDTPICFSTPFMWDKQSMITTLKEKNLRQLLLISIIVKEIICCRQIVVCKCTDTMYMETV